MTDKKAHDDWINDQHREMVKRKCYGKLTVHYEAGKVTTVRKEETVKPPDK